MPARDERQRSALLSFVTPVLSSGEQVVAVLPYVNTPKRPKGAEGKVREGIWQSQQRYRPLLLTNQRLFVFDTARTPHPRQVLCEVPSGSVRTVRTFPLPWEERPLCSTYPATANFVRARALRLRISTRSRARSREDPNRDDLVDAEPGGAPVRRCCAGRAGSACGRRRPGRRRDRADACRLGTSVLGYLVELFDLESCELASATDRGHSTSYRGVLCSRMSSRRLTRSTPGSAPR